MASEYIQDFAFHQISQAVMATANSVANAASHSSGESSIFDVVRRKLGKMQDVIQGITSPLKRRSMYEELSEHVWPSEQIEMSRLVHRGLGHNFLPCHLSNPTWCDYCGDFIWGVYKQCLRCHTCQYTCHQQCLPAVTLNCKSISDDGSEVAASRTPSPSDPPSHKETSLSVGKPGCARNASGQSSSSTNTSIPRVSESAPDFHIIQENNGAVDSGSSMVHSDLIYDYFDTPKVTRLPSHHLSRSASESIFAGHTSHAPHMNKRSSLTPQASQGHNTSSPQCTPVHTNRLSGSAQEANIQTYLPRGTLLKTAELNGKLQERIADSSVVIQGNDVTACNNTNNTSQNPDSSDDKLLDLPNLDANQEATSERDETDSGYRSGTIPDDKLPRVPSQATLDREVLSRTIAKYNHFVPAAGLDMTGKESFQGFVKVTMNLIRPITMELGARPPSIYELLTREHIIEENTQQVAFYMPRDTHKSLHITSETTTKEVVASLLKKFHILDHPRKFAMYEQEFSDNNKLVRLRRLTDKDFPLRAILNWDPERITNYRMVLQENETGEIVWDVFSLPELGNFLKVLDREEKETILELKHKYAYMKQYMERRLAELRNERNKQTKC